MLVVVATPTMAGLEAFTKGLIDAGAEVVHARSGMATLEIAKARAPALVIVDTGLPDFASLELVRELARTNAMITTAVISDLSAKTFHDKAEGLGVLRQIKSQPGDEEAREIMALIRRIFAMSPPSGGR